MTIDDIIWETVKLEGGYSNNPADKGGKTNYGITEKVARDNGYNDDMRSMGVSWAFDIYKREYFMKPKFNEIYKYSPAIAKELFDTGVNMGTGTAAKFLQESLNLLNYNGKLYPDMVVDGVIGNITLLALEKLLKHSNKAESVLIKCLNGLQFMRYKSICDRDKTQEVFVFGWLLNRI